MIQKAQVDKAVAAADEALEKQPNFAWITQSSLLLRVYRMGLLAGLRGIAEPEHLAGLTVDLIHKSFYAHSADDTFEPTRLGQVFKSLKSPFRGDSSNPRASGDTLAQIVSEVQALDQEWQIIQKRTHSILIDLHKLISSKPPTASKPQPADESSEMEFCQLRAALETRLRKISLLEIDHRIWKRFET